MADYKRKLPFWEILILGVLCLGVLGGGVMVAKKLIESRPRSERKAPEVKYPLVNVQDVEPISHQVWVSSMGTIVPSSEVTLQAEVSGRIVEVHPDFVEGGLVSKGEMLVRIDSRDYDTLVVSNEASVENAVYELKLEEGQQDIARREWELLGLGKDATDLERELALRKPQLRQKEAQLKASQANLEQARLNQERTMVKAPFNAIVRSADVRVGDLAAGQTTLGTLVSTESYWAEVTVPLDRLKWLKLAGGGALVKTGTGTIRKGRIIKLLSDLEPEGRMAQLLVEINDPLELKKDVSERSPLLLGEYVNVGLEGKVLEDVYAIPRSALRDGDLLWMVGEDKTLQIVSADIVWKDLEHVYLKELPVEGRIVVSDLSVPVDGMMVSPMSVENEMEESDEPGQELEGEYLSEVIKEVFK